MNILRSNFEYALMLAIEYREGIEHKLFGAEYESALVSGWKEVLQASKECADINIQHVY